MFESNFADYGNFTLGDSWLSVLMRTLHTSSQCLPMIFSAANSASYFVLFQEDYTISFYCETARNYSLKFCTKRDLFVYRYKDFILYFSFNWSCFENISWFWHFLHIPIWVLPILGAHTFSGSNLPYDLACKATFNVSSEFNKE